MCSRFVTRKWWFTIQWRIHSRVHWIHLIIMEKSGINKGWLNTCTLAWFHDIGENFKSRMSEWCNKFCCLCYENALLLVKLRVNPLCVVAYYRIVKHFHELSKLQIKGIIQENSIHFILYVYNTHLKIVIACIQKIDKVRLWSNQLIVRRTHSQ